MKRNSKKKIDKNAEKKAKKQKHETVDEMPEDEQEATGEDEAATEATEELQDKKESEFEIALKDRDSFKDQLLRLRAEFDNYRKRMAREAKHTRETAAEEALLDMLPVLDHLELALQHAADDSGTLAEGVELVLKQMQDALSKHGLKHIPALGEVFDPNVHEALMQVESDEYDEGIVAQEFLKGYMLARKVLRPAKVVVSKGKADETPAENGQEQQEPKEVAAEEQN